MVICNNFSLGTSLALLMEMPRPLAYCELETAATGTVRDMEGMVAPFFTLRERERCRPEGGLLNSTTSVEGGAGEKAVRLSQDFFNSGFPLIVLRVTRTLFSV